jgi:hypothetical protein
MDDITEIDTGFPIEEDIDYGTPALMPDDHAAALERASWHMRKAAMLTAERDELAAVYRREMERLELRLEHRRRILNERIAWHEEPVRQLHLALLRSNPKRKTIELPYGTSKVRVPATPKVSITDNAALLAWAESNRPELLGRSINVTAIRTVAVPKGKVAPGETGEAVDSETGEVIPGVAVTLDAPSWSSSYEQEAHE